MSEITLERLRKLRARAEDLLRSIDADLRPFLHQDGETFRRKPDSKSIDNDVNVTTTCSCLMSLALTNEFRKFYSLDKEDGESIKARNIFQKVVQAPWMSSGLTANNGFTTTLVLRTYGFLVKYRLLRPPSEEVADTNLKKAWQVNIGISDLSALVSTLRDPKDPPSQFLYSSVSDNARLLLNKAISEEDSEKKKHEDSLRSTLTLDLSRLVQNGWIYDTTKFPNASEKNKADLNKIAKSTTAYELARINHSLLIDQFPAIFNAPAEITLPSIANVMAANADNFSINEYPTSAAVVYWFVDGVDRGKIILEAPQWKTLCDWAVESFSRERSLVLAGHDAMMDPVAMAMAACLCARLRRICDEGILGATKQHHVILPSDIELEHSVEQLFNKQSSSGIWPKYFPLFHYQDAGSNFCFTFELLEAVLYEFAGSENHLLELPKVVGGLENAVTWCEKNRLPFSEDNESQYTGWNSGGDLQTLQKGQPESWATAVVHMFLCELISVLSQHIQRKILEKYQTVFPAKKAKKLKSEVPVMALDQFMDIDLIIQEKSTSLKEVLKLEFVGKHANLTEIGLRREKAKSPLSALLFGPPGTSKTEVTKAISEDLSWPLVQINPSEFVKNGFQNVYLRADEIFQDMMDLSGVVVFFDEMDALTQSRDKGDRLDTATQFLTTSMLPKLTDLHDRGRVIFFMATNVQTNFDPAIKRAGRFDMLLCMGPPKLEDKLQLFHLFFGLKKSNPQTEKAVAMIREYVKESVEIHDQLSLYTFGEFKSFVKGLGVEKTIGDEIEAKLKKPFIDGVETYSKSVTLRMHDLRALPSLATVGLKDLDGINTNDFKNKKISNTEIAKYALDRRASCRQY